MRLCHSLTVFLSLWSLGSAGAQPVTSPVLASEPTEDVENLGTDESVERNTAEAATTIRMPLFSLDAPLYQRHQAMKESLKRATGLELALESTTIYQVTSGVRDANNAAVHSLGLFGRWVIYQNPNKIDGAGIGFSIENRSNPTSDHFQELTSDLGTVWSPNDSTSSSYDKISQLWWGQRLLEGKLIFIVGKIDPGVSIGSNRFAGSGNTQFFSQPFATNPARSFPDNGIGAMVRIRPSDTFHVQFAMSDSDARSDASPFTTIDGHWFYVGEVAVKAVSSSLGEGFFRFNAYYRDADDAAASGTSLSFDQDLGESLGVFLRYGWNDGELTSIHQIAATGISFNRPFGRINDQAGLGVAWTQPTDGDLREESSAEVYYRVQLTHFIELSGSAIWVVDPSASDESSLAVFGLRLRALF